MMSQIIEDIVKLYKEDKESIYNTWFVNNEDRLKAFRTIRRGVLQVIKDIKEDHFGNDFKGSSLEFVLTCITEQRQVFEGAAHPFYWKPKLRIPDIYENQQNKKAFGQFLENCINASKEEQIIKEIVKLDSLKIKGLGPAVASILYFLHPTIVPPFNTAILNGHNYLFKDNKKLGSWTDYLKIRESILQTNEKFKKDFSNDLGAMAGMLFDIGVKKLFMQENDLTTEEDRIKSEKQFQKRHKEVLEQHEEENIHTEMQFHLLKIGSSLGYDVIAASNDRSRSYNGNNFSFMSLPKFPVLDIDKNANNTINLVDVIWFEKGTNKIVSAFEVEKSTSIYSGILRLSDLSFTFHNSDITLFLIIPDSREKEVVMQLQRPSIKNNNVIIKYVLFSDLRQHCDALCKFGDDHKIMEKVAKAIA